MNIFTALKRVFSTGLIVSDIKNDSIKIIDTQRSQAYSKRNTFFDKLHRNQYYQSTLAQNYSINRLALYRDYDMMDADPILSSALDVYTFQALTKDEYGDILKIYSNDTQIQQILKELFYQRLNCQFNFSVWFRSFVKYGDFFLALRLDDELGIIGSQPISAYDIQRVEDDERNPDAYFFRFVSGGDSLIDNYNIAHFRLLRDPNFLPYGRSMLEPARRIWKNFSLMVDAMMIQRIMRAPERRVFKIDVGDLDNQQIERYMQDVINKMKKVPYKDPQTGQINLKYNIQNLLEDFFIPVKGRQDGSSIETLAGMQNNMIEDIEFVKSYMLAALKIPKAFLTFEQGIEAKCFSPYTKIKLLDGRILSLLQLSNIYDQNPNVKLETLCYDFQLKRFVPATIKWCSKTRRNAQMVRVHIDNDTYVDVTPDHNFILKDLSLKMAKDLTNQDQLLSYDINIDCNIEKYNQFSSEINKEIFENRYNHKVICVQQLAQKMDTYNLQVEHKDHNIVLHDNGIVIKQSTLASLDIIFARLIEDLQNLFVSQLYRIALIHLFILGYTDINDINFKLQLNNPSNVKKLQEIELWQQKLDIATKMEESHHFSLKFIFENIYDINSEESQQLLKQVVDDAKFKAQLLAIEQSGGMEGMMQPVAEESQQQPTEESQLQQEMKEQNEWNVQDQPLTNKFQGNSPLHLDK